MYGEALIKQRAIRWCCVEPSSTPLQMVACSDSTSITRPLFFSDYPSGFVSLWFRNKANIFGSGAELYWRTVTGQWTEFLLIGNFKRSARGTAENDIYFVGDFGTVVHFNGYSMNNFQVSLPNWRYAAVSCKGRTMCAVGWRNDAGFALIGRRQ